MNGIVMIRSKIRIHSALWAVTMVLFLGLVLAGRVEFAQTPNGTLSGDVTDSEGALVPGANIHVIGEQTGVEKQFTTTSAGHYIFSDLLPGTYRVEVSQSGFKAEIRTGRRNIDRIDYGAEHFFKSWGARLKR